MHCILVVYSFYIKFKIMLFKAAIIGCIKMIKFSAL